jgi:hypothetical protein
MGYSVKVNIAKDMSLEVSGDELYNVVQLLNQTTRKFFPIHPGPDIEI